MKRKNLRVNSSHNSKAHSLLTPCTLISFAKAKFGCEILGKVLNFSSLSFLICKGVVGATYPPKLVSRLSESQCLKQPVWCLAYYKLGNMVPAG